MKNIFAKNYSMYSSKKGAWQIEHFFSRRDEMSWVETTGIQDYQPINLQAIVQEAVKHVVGKTIEHSTRNYWELSSKINSLESDIKRLIEEIEEKPTIKNTVIYDLGSDDISLKQPLHIIIEEYTDEVIAKFLEIEAFGSGDNESEAINELKADILNLYDELKNSKEKLGKLPRTWLRILNNLIVKE